MRRAAPLLLTSLGLAALGLCLGCGARHDAASQVRSEIGRLRREVDAMPAADEDWRRLAPGLRAALARAGSELRAGRLYSSLEELDQARDRLRAIAAIKEQPVAGSTPGPGAGATDGPGAGTAAGPGAGTAAGPGEATAAGTVAATDPLAGFGAVWGRTRVELAALDRAARARVWTASPAAVRALSETAQAKSTTLLQASRAYAPATTAEAGLYYLGEAKAAAESAAFSRSLALDRLAAPLPLHSVLPRIRALQDLTTAAFQPPRSIRLHPAFIRLNATLDLAAELDAAGFYAGAMVQALDAAQQLALLEPAEPGRSGSPAAAAAPAPSGLAAPAATEHAPKAAAEPAALRAAVAAVRARLAADGRDPSIAELFLQRAEAQLAVADAEASAGAGAPSRESQESRMQAAAIVERVFPVYFAMLGPAVRPAPPPAGAIAVTLVRWPFT